MKLKSFGCSFIFGSDLADDGRDGPMAKGSAFTFPAIIAKTMDMDYTTFARPGASNIEILAWVLGEVYKQEPAIYMINWTYIDRFGYTREDIATHKRPWNPLGWTSIMPIDMSDLAKCYYRDIHSQLRDKFESLNAMKSAIDALRSADHKFVMTWTDALVWETKWHCPPVVEYLQKQVAPWCSDFEGMSFLNWSRQRSFAISDADHPLEQAHQAAADLIIDNWDQYLCHSA